MLPSYLGLRSPKYKPNPMFLWSDRLPGDVGEAGLQRGEGNDDLLDPPGGVSSEAVAEAGEPIIDGDGVRNGDGLLRMDICERLRRAAKSGREDANSSSVPC